jgi:hypothetical protein
MGMPPFIHSARPSACAPVRPSAVYSPSLAYSIATPGSLTSA